MPTPGIDCSWSDWSSLVLSKHGRGILGSVLLVFLVTYHGGDLLPSFTIYITRGFITIIHHHLGDDLFLWSTGAPHVRYLCEKFQAER